MNTNNNKPTRANFPICLLRGFEENPKLTACKILSFVRNRVKEKKGEEAVKEITGFDFVPTKTEKNSIYTSCNFDYLYGIATGRAIDTKEIECFLFLCAIRSIIQHQNYTLSNWKAVAYRAAGHNKVDKNIELKGTCKRFTFQSKKFRQNLIDFVENAGIGIYSAIGVHGFYIYQNIELLEVVAHVNEIKKARKEESEKINKLRDSLVNCYKTGVLKNTINAVMKQDIYTSDFGKFVCENAKQGTPAEFKRLANQFFSYSF